MRKFLKKIFTRKKKLFIDKHSGSKLERVKIKVDKELWDEITGGQIRKNGEVVNNK